MYLFILVSHPEKPDNYQLKIAPSYTDNFKPQVIDLPIKRIKDHSFTVLDTDHGEIYLAINHEDENAKMTNVYVSDFKGF